MLICNWKMFGNKALVQAYVSLLSEKSAHDVIVCPPAPLMGLFPKNIVLGAQNCHEAVEGAFTGEISAKILAEMGCQYVLLGHSERRQYYSETNTLVAQKAETALQCGLKPIVCVGSGAEDILQIQGDIAKQFDALGSSDMVVAYEPLWAIGSNRTPSIQHIQTITDWIRSQGFRQVTYGGSVNVQNAADIRAICDGVLIGRASLDINSLGALLL